MNPATLAHAALRAPVPRIGEMVAALVILTEVAVLGMLTVGLRFQLVDWRVESRDLQAALRDLEGERTMLRRDVAALATGERLLQLAEDQFNLVAARPDQLVRVAIPLDRANAWNAVLARPAQGAGSASHADQMPTWSQVLERMAPAEAAVDRLRTGVTAALPLTPPARPRGAAADADAGTSDREVP